MNGTILPATWTLIKRCCSRDRNNRHCHNRNKSTIWLHAYTTWKNRYIMYARAIACTIVKRIQIVYKSFVCMCALLQNCQTHSHPTPTHSTSHSQSRTFTYIHLLSDTCACNTLYDFQTHTRVYVHRGTWCVFAWYFGGGFGVVVLLLSAFLLFVHTYSHRALFLRFCTYTVQFLIL